MKFIINLLHLETGKKTLKLGALPTDNLPKKSVETTKPSERRQLSYHERNPTQTTNDQPKLVYRNLDDFIKKLSRTATIQNNWNVKSTSYKCSMKYFCKPYSIPKYEIVIDDSLGFTIAVFGWLLSDQHFIYKEFRQSIRTHTIFAVSSKLLLTIMAQH